MTSTGRPRGFGSDPPTGSGRARGLLHALQKVVGDKGLDNGYKNLETMVFKIAKDR